MNYIRLSDDNSNFVIRLDQLLGFYRGRDSSKTTLKLVDQTPVTNLCAIRQSKR